MKVRLLGLLLFVGASSCLADPPLLVLVPKQFQFPAPATVSQDPLKQVLAILNDTHADMEWSSAIVTSSGGNWLTLTPSSGTVGPPPNSLPDGPSFMKTSVSVSPAGFRSGVYTGSITITASRLYQGVNYSAINSPQTVTVTYTVPEPKVPAVSVSTNFVALSGVAGIGNVITAPVAVNNAGEGTLNWSAALQNPGSATWLSVAPASGVDTGNFVVKANPSFLAPGMYSASVAVTAPASPTQIVAISFSVRAPKPATLDISTASLNFNVMAGQNPAPNAVAISNSGELAINWKASSSTFNGGQWLFVSPAAGINNGSVVITPNAAFLPPGIYAGRITVSGGENTALQAQIPVILIVSRKVTNLSGGGFFNAASLTPNTVVAGSLASIFGENLGPDTAVAANLDSAAPAPAIVLGGTRVTIDGTAAPLFYASSKQINLQIPYEASGKSSVIARIEAEGYDPADFSIKLSPAHVELFTVDGTRANALNQDGTINASTNPAQPGSVVQLFATGQGPLDVALATGAVAPSQAAPFTPLTPISVRIGGLRAKILFSGLAPGLIGILQINVEIPSGTKPSDLTLVQTQTGGEEPNSVYISTSAQ